MPFYQYECTTESCHHTLEEMQSIKAEPLAKCPKCGQETLRRVFSPPGLIFKGSGFYINDYGRNKGLS